MRLVLVTVLAMLSLSSFAQRHGYPLRPDPQMTPGSLCDRPTTYRYANKFPPKGIPYCERDVTHMTKDYIFEEYRRAGYKINKNERSSYKIDHYIPLCAGGSNYEDNLWPQHRDIFEKTDLMEAEGCLTLKEGKIDQATLVELIKRGKADVSLVPQIIIKLRSLR